MKRRRAGPMKSAAGFIPIQWPELRRHMPDNVSLPQYYAGMVNSRNLSEQVKAASLYGNYERVLGQLVPNLEKNGSDTGRCVNAARIYINYAAADFMLKPDQIMCQIDKIRHLPAFDRSQPAGYGLSVDRRLASA